MKTDVPVSVAPRDRFSSLIDETTTDFKVDVAAYTDPEVYEAEIKRIFERSWIYIGHTSEVKAPGDFRTRYIGRQPVILARGKDAEIHVLFNMCRHRGMVVCREHRGNVKAFRCDYHGWVYDTNGRLTGIAEPDGYRRGIRDDLDGLLPVPRMQIYHDLIFASLDPQIVTFEEYMGEALEFVDLWVKRAPNGQVEVLDPHCHSYSANWKFQAEQDVDGYHGKYVHASAFKTRDAKEPDATDTRKISVHGNGRTMGFPGGHALLERPGTRGGLRDDQLQTYEAALASAYGSEQVPRINCVRHVFIYPSVYLMDDHIRMHQPISVDQTEVYSFPTRFGGVDDSINESRLMQLQWRHSQAGLIGPDDVEMFVGSQSGMAAASVKWIYLSRGLESEVTQADGTTIGESSSETPMRAIHREWKRKMSAIGEEVGQ